MWIVRIALNRPYTFVVLALVILLASPLVILRTATDIFPNIAIPVVSVIWNYDGFAAQEMADRIVTINERGLIEGFGDHCQSSRGQHYRYSIPQGGSRGRCRGATRILYLRTA